MKEANKNTNAKFGRRLTAFLIDIIIITVITSIISFFIPTSEKYDTLLKEYTSIMDKVAQNSENITQLSTQLNNVAYSISKETYLVRLIEVFITALYFIVFQFKNGQTLGKKIMGIKIIKEGGDISYNDLILRSLIVNSLFSSIISLSLLYVVNKNLYMSISQIAIYVNFIFIIVSIGYMLFRRDKRSLHDIITNTKVVEINE